MRSICDHECVWTYIVTAGTAKTVTITDGKQVQNAVSVRRLLNTGALKLFLPTGAVFHGTQFDSITTTGAALLLPLLIKIMEVLQ